MVLGPKAALAPASGAAIAPGERAASSMVAAKSRFDIEASLKGEGGGKTVAKP
ncbi:hypothetical protein D3C86_2038950 [compost metagenome]